MIVSRYVILFGCAALLSGCDSAEKRASSFVPRCLAAGFTVQQCALLFSMSEDAKSDNESTQMVAGVALGASVAK